ncbi:E3 ubiquitin-protein ligase LUL3 [Spatholobus suberectus]|nr:E3 ubiquitin-protein ligase LUL3 [Spatholobus suberectus]
MATSISVLPSGSKIAINLNSSMHHVAKRSFYNTKTYIAWKLVIKNKKQFKSLMGKVQGFSLLSFGGCFDSCRDHTRGSGYGTRIWNLSDRPVELQIRVGSILKKIHTLKPGSSKRLKCKSIYKAYMPGRSGSVGGSLKSLLYYYDETCHPYIWIHDIGCHSLRMAKQQYVSLEDLRDSSEIKIFWDHQRGSISKKKKHLLSSSTSTSPTPLLLPSTSAATSAAAAAATRLLCYLNQPLCFYHRLRGSSPPPPPQYYPNGYTANSVMLHHQHQPLYANQGGSGIHASPPPYVDHQTTKKIRNDVNLHKHTLRLSLDPNHPDHHLISFDFDALYDGSITIFYLAKEEEKCRFIPLFPDVFEPITFPFQKGAGQKFCQPSGTGIDLGFFELDDLSRPSPGEDVFPLVICAETSLRTPLADETTSNSVLDASPHMQITQAILEKSNGSSTAADFDDNDPGKECVICMTEPKDTAVLPCRHMCMCGECANALRLQSNKCPICRQPIEELIEIKINNGNQ